MSADDLAAALAALGLPGHVEARGSFAILTVTDPVLLAAAADAGVRARAVALAGEHGFATLALELASPADADAGAAVSGD